MMKPKEFFKENGYYFVPKLITDIETLQVPVPKERGQITYYHNRMDKFDYCPDESQVPGSLARYNIPTYRELHFLVKKKIETILEMDLHPTYFYDRFYFPGQELIKHTDRPACEISVTLQINSNAKKSWPIWFETPDEREVSVSMKNGDACIYKGCERPHWREPLKSNYNPLQRIFKKDDTYHHQIFLHYVNANGPYVHCAFDASRP